MGLARGVLRDLLTLVTAKLLSGSPLPNPSLQHSLLLMLGQLHTVTELLPI